MTEAPGHLVHVTAILGRVGEPPFVERRVDPVRVGSADAAKRRLRRTSAGGVELAIDLPRGSFLADGAVLVDRGEAVVAVERAAEEVVLVRLDPGLDRTALVEAAARIGHAFGNQHVPLDIAGEELVVPIGTSVELVLATIEGLELPGVATRAARAKLACDRPLPIGHAHGGQDATRLRVRRP